MSTGEIGGKRVTVYGLGRFGGGIAVTRWLCGQGAVVTVTDKDSPAKLADSAAKLAGLPVQFHLGEERDGDFTGADLVVASPAIPPGNPRLAAARAAGVPITTEIRLFIERCPARILGVTGTKGKSTTTAMLGKMLGTIARTWVGGNIGGSLLEDLPNIRADDLVVLELSSYMLHHLGEMRWSPHVGVVTMISKDHIEWHGSLEAYLEAKSNLIRFQQADDYAVLNEEDPGAASLARIANGRTIFFGTHNRKRFDLLLRGQHNQLNAQGAFAAASVMGVDWETARKALADFPALPHRLQRVHEADGIEYYDDSIATIPDAAVAALDAFPPRKVIQIVGGYDKGLPITEMCGALVERAKAVLCIGATGSRLAEVIEQSAATGGAGCWRCGDLPTAVNVARSIAVPGDVVLLSPGFASYDQFVNFEKRGEEFAQLVGELKSS